MAQTTGGDGRVLDRTDNHDPLLDDEPVAANGSISAKELRSFVERIERLEREKQFLAEDMKQIKLEAKASGFNVKVLNFVVRERRQDREDLEEFNTVLETYRHALGT
jgi:uncharacterized protein (UPF0335 family)